MSLLKAPKFFNHARTELDHAAELADNGNYCGTTRAILNVGTRLTLSGVQEVGQGVKSIDIKRATTGVVEVATGALLMTTCNIVAGAVTIDTPRSRRRGK